MAFSEEDGGVKKHQKDECLKDVRDGQSEPLGPDISPDLQDWKRAPLSHLLGVTAVRNAPWLVMGAWRPDRGRQHLKPSIFKLGNDGDE